MKVPARPLSGQAQTSEQARKDVLVPYCVALLSLRSPTDRRLQKETQVPMIGRALAPFPLCSRAVLVGLRCSECAARFLAPNNTPTPSFRGKPLLGLHLKPEKHLWTTPRLLSTASSFSTSDPLSRLIKNELKKQG